jgi:hypothetical protein
MLKYFCVIGLLLCTLTVAYVPHAAADDEALRIPAKLGPCLDQLLALADHDNRAQPDMAAIGPVIDYLLTPKDPKATYTAGQKNGATSNYYEFSLNLPIETLVALTYNPAIPAYLIIPASLHTSRWIEIDGSPQKPFPDLSTVMRSLNGPMLIKGVEKVENTPDTNSGAYYAYTMDRAILLTRYHGQRVLLSMSRQRGKSDVGKKGLVLGDDDDWNYLYTGEKGCMRPGLGWANTYMYNSESIAVYYEETKPTAHVRCAVYKWVDAGWAGINMAQPIHIKNGVKRFVKTFKEVVESPALPDPDVLAAAIRRIENLPTDALRQEVGASLNLLKTIHQDDNRINRKWFAQLFENDRYVQALDREELIAAVCKEYLKYLLGKSHSFDIAFLEKAKIQPKRPG